MDSGKPTSEEVGMIQFRPAVRESVGLLIGLAGPSGGGKSYSAMRLAKGICGDKSFAVIDTEAGRAKHYADFFKFDHADLKPPFRPEAYAEAIAAADKAGYEAIIVDSMSLVWSGDGGVLDWQEEELNRMAGDDWKKREAVKMAAWIKPKMSHKHMVQKLLQVRAHLILAFRAEEKVEMVRGEDGKMKVVPKKGTTSLDGWWPVCEKNLPYELTASFLLTPDAPGVPKPIKLQAQHRAMFPLDSPITEDSGKRILEWAKGSTSAMPPLATNPTASDAQVGQASGRLGTGGSAGTYISGREAADLEAWCSEVNIPIKALLAAAKVDSIEHILLSDVARANNWIKAQIKAREANEAATRG